LAQLKGRQPAADWMLGRAGLDGGSGGLDVGEPAPRGGAGLVIEVAANPFQYLVAGLLVGEKRRPVNGDQTAAALHLLFEDEQSVADEQWMVLLAPIAAAGDQ